MTFFTEQCNIVDVQWTQLKLIPPPAKTWYLEHANHQILNCTCEIVQLYLTDFSAPRPVYQLISGRHMDQHFLHHVFREIFLHLNPEIKLKENKKVCKLVFSLIWRKDHVKKWILFTQTEKRIQTYPKSWDEQPPNQSGCKKVDQVLNDMNSNVLWLHDSQVHLAGVKPSLVRWFTLYHVWRKDHNQWYYNHCIVTTE